MKVPNLSYLSKVAELRYVQATYEAGPYRNPDFLAGQSLTMFQKLACDLRGRTLLNRLRAQPFYYYVIARTHYYDVLFLDAVCAKAKCIVIVGCGIDTRAYRFAHLLRDKGIRVLECDQPDVIAAKRELARRRWPNEHVDYLPIDLNRRSWPDFQQWLRERSATDVFVMMEGVSPYINRDSFGVFLETLSHNLKPGSGVAYDYKLRGIADEFGISVSTPVPFRLSDSKREAVDYHAARGYHLEHLELSRDLLARYLPHAGDKRIPVFNEDALVRLRTADQAESR